MSILLVVTVLLIVVGLACVWYLTNESPSFVIGDHDTETQLKEGNPTLKRLCEENKHAGTITIYTNAAGEVGGYRVYDSNMDGGTSKYYKADGSFIGEWGIIPLDSLEKMEFAKQIEKFPIRNTTKCNQ